MPERVNASDSRTLERQASDATASHPGARDVSSDDLVGRSLLHFRVVARLGEGGMGVVYRAIDEKLRRAVALKVLGPRYLVDERNKELIFREARSAAALAHPNIAAIYEVHDGPDGAFYVMELVEGETLRARIEREGKLSVDEALRWGLQIARALARAHESGVVHRDHKADNVMIASSGEVKLLDFGLAKVVDVEDAAFPEATGDLPGGPAALAPTMAASGRSTEHGRVMGTPAYMAPEQARGELVDARADVFAFGVVLYEMVTGVRPFAHREGVPWSWGDGRSGDWTPRARVRELAPRASRDIEQLVQRCTAFDREARFADGAALVTAIEACRRRDRSRRARVGWTLAASAAVVLGGAAWAMASLTGGFSIVRGRSLVPDPELLHPHAPAALVVSIEKPLACPIFQIEGAPEIAPRLGAAAAALACMRANWYLGGSDEKVLVPGALLDAPVRPLLQEIPDPFATPDARARTLEVAKTRSLPSLDGTVSRVRDGWRARLVVRATDGAEIARAEGQAPYFELAIKNAVIRLWQTAPLAPAAIDPEVARWTGYPDIETGLLRLDQSEVGSHRETCAAVHRRGSSLGGAYLLLNASCAAPPAVDAGVPPLDESSAPALLESVRDHLDGVGVFPDDESRRLALELESMRVSETSRFGRASIGRIESVLWFDANETERSYAAALSAIGDDPLLALAWHHLGHAADLLGSYAAVTSIASAWFPQEPLFLNTNRNLRQSDHLEGNLRETELSYTLEPTVIRTVFRGRALAEAGRLEEVRTLTVATPADLSAPDPRCTADLLAFIDLHDAMFARAVTRFQDGDATGMQLVPIVASVLGRTSATATRWAASFLDEPDDKVEGLVGAASSPIALCMSADGALARRCMSRVERLGGKYNAWGVGGDLFLAGAKRYAAGDVRGAVDTWRPIVATSNDYVIRLLPTEAFERSGEPDLAARIDARKMLYRQFAGVSDAAPREARRAFDRGDRARAKELATSVVRAWEVADATVPAVAEMRALLAKIGD